MLVWQGFILPFVKNLTTILQFGSAFLGVTIGILKVWETFSEIQKRKRENKK